MNKMVSLLTLLMVVVSENGALVPTADGITANENYYSSFSLAVFSDLYYLTLKSSSSASRW